MNGVGTGVIRQFLAHQHPIAHHARDQFRQCGTINTGRLDQFGLGQPFALGRGVQYRELALGQLGAGHGLGKSFSGKLLGTVKQVTRRLRQVEVFRVRL